MRSSVVEGTSNCKGKPPLPGVADIFEKIGLHPNGLQQCYRAQVSAFKLSMRHYCSMLISIPREREPPSCSLLTTLYYVVMQAPCSAYEYTQRCTSLIPITRLESLTL